MLQHTGYLKMTWTQLAPAQQDLVKYFLQRSVEVLSSCAPSAVGPKCVKHILAFVEWFKTHKERDVFGPPLEVWETACLPAGIYSFIPVVRIRRPVAISPHSFNMEDGFVTVAL